MAGRGGAAGGLATPVVLLLEVWIAWLLLPASRPRPLRAPGLLFAVLLLAYMATGRTVDAWDTWPARVLPFSILREGNLDLDEFRFLHATSPPHFLTRAGGHWVSSYPIGPAVLAVPFYVPAVLGGVDPQSPLVPQLEKLAAATMVAASALLLYLAARRLAGAAAALPVALVYGLATSNLSVASQALWQHGPSLLLLTAALYALVRARDDPRWAGWAGFPLAFAVVTRPIDLPLVAPLAVHVLVRHPSQVLRFLLSAVPPVLLEVGYDLAYWGRPLASHLPAGIASPLEPWLWSTPVREGLAGLLVSPTRGLLVYSPVLLLSLVGLALAWRRGGDRLLRALGPGVLLTLLVLSKWYFWWGGSTFGPRLLADLNPSLALGLVPLAGAVRRRRALTVTFAVRLGWSVAAHGIGAYHDDGSWNGCPPGIDLVPARRWSWTDNQLVNPPRELLRRAVVRVRGLPTSRSAPAALAAAYELPGTSGELRVRAGALLELDVRATNTGTAAWLAHARDGRGVVRLGARWWRDGRPAAVLEARAPLCGAVFPGEAARLRLWVVAPAVAGTHELEVGLLSEGLAWFADVGTPPVRIPVAVLPAP
jgi:hypothetical protein